LVASTSSKAVLMNWQPSCSLMKCCPLVRAPRMKVCTQSSTDTGKTSCAMRSRWMRPSTRTSLMRRLHRKHRASSHSLPQRRRKPRKQRLLKRLHRELVHHAVPVVPVVVNPHSIFVPTFYIRRGPHDASTYDPRSYPYGSRRLPLLSGTFAR